MGIVRPFKWFRTSVDLSEDANDVRLWLSIVRYGWDTRTVFETAVIDLGRKTGYDPDWKTDPRNQEKINRWLEHHTGKKQRAFIRPEPATEATMEVEQGHGEEERIEVYA